MIVFLFTSAIYVLRKRVCVPRKSAFAFTIQPGKNIQLTVKVARVIGISKGMKKYKGRGIKGA